MLNDTFVSTVLGETGQQPFALQCTSIVDEELLDGQGRVRERQLAEQGLIARLRLPR